MAVVFGLVSYALLHLHSGPQALLSGLILTGAIFSSMLVVEDFMWFTLRASAPFEGDMNGGSLVKQGEWSTQFLGSIDAHMTAIPNWYFLNALFTFSVFLITRTRPRLAEAVAPTP